MTFPSAPKTSGQVRTASAGVQRPWRRSRTHLTRRARTAATTAPTAPGGLVAARRSAMLVGGSGRAGGDRELLASLRGPNADAVLPAGACERSQDAPVRLRVRPPGVGPARRRRP